MENFVRTCKLHAVRSQFWNQFKPITSSSKANHCATVSQPKRIKHLKSFSNYSPISSSTNWLFLCWWRLHQCACRFSKIRIYPTNQHYIASPIFSQHNSSPYEPIHFQSSKILLNIIWPASSRYHQIISWLGSTHGSPQVTVRPPPRLTISGVSETHKITLHHFMTSHVQVMTNLGSRRRPSGNLGYRCRSRSRRCLRSRHGDHTVPDPLRRTHQHLSGGREEREVTSVHANLTLGEVWRDEDAEASLKFDDDDVCFLRTRIQKLAPTCFFFQCKNATI